MDKATLGTVLAAVRGTNLMEEQQLRRQLALALVDTAAVMLVYQDYWSKCNDLRQDLKFLLGSSEHDYEDLSRKFIVMCQEMIRENNQPVEEE